MAGDGPTLVLARHGETEWSASRPAHRPHRRAAHRDGARAGASASGSGWPAGASRSCSRARSRRARDTCALAGFGDGAQVEPDLREFDYGDYEGITTPEIRETRPGWNLWRDGAPGGERPERRRRARRPRDRPRAGGRRRRGAVRARTRAARARRPLDRARRAAYGGNLALGTASLSELGYERERRAIWLWNDTQPPVIETVETERLRGEPDRAEHADGAARAARRPARRRDARRHADAEQVRELVAPSDGAHWARHGFGYWLWREKATGACVGRGGLHRTHVGGRDEVEVGWAVMPDRWGEGFATELGRASARVAFERLELLDVVAFTLLDNHASRRVMEKLGFVYERDVLHAGLPHVLCRLTAPDPARAGLTIRRAGQPPFKLSDRVRLARVARQGGLVECDERRWMWGLPAATVALAAGAFATFASAGGSPPPDRSPHLLVVPDTPARAGRAGRLRARARRRLRRLHARRGDAATTSRALSAPAPSLRDDMREVRIGTRTSDPPSTARRCSTRPARPCAGRQGRPRPRGRPVRRPDQGRVDRRPSARPACRSSPTWPRTASWCRATTPRCARLAELAARAAFVRAITPVHGGRQARCPASRRAGRASASSSRPSPATAGADARAAVRAVSAPTRDELHRRPTFTQQHVSLDAARLARPGRARRRRRGRARRRARSCSTSARRRSSPAALNASFQPVLGTGYRQFLADNGFATNSGRDRRHHRRGRRQGRRPGAGRLAPRLLPPRRADQPEPHHLRPGGDRGDADARDCGGHGTNVASIATGYNRRPGAAYEDAQGFNYGLGHRPLRAPRRDEDLQLRRATSTSRRRSPRCTTRPTPPARGSPTTRGARPSAAPTHAARRSSTRSCATPSPASPATRSSPRSSRPATTAPGGNTIGSPGHGQERDHGRRVRERARDRRHRRLRRARHRRQQRPRHHRLLQPRPDRRRAHQAGHRRAGHARRRARSRRRAPTSTARAPATRSSRPAARSTRWSRARRRPRRRRPGFAALLRNLYRDEAGRRDDATRARR